MATTIGAKTTVYATSNDHNIAAHRGVVSMSRGAVYGRRDGCYDNRRSHTRTPTRMRTGLGRALRRKRFASATR